MRHLAKLSMFMKCLMNTDLPTASFSKALRLLRFGVCDAMKRSLMDSSKYETEYC